MRNEALEQYKKAQKLGQKNYKDCVLNGRYPYLQVLDSFLDESMTIGQIELGLVEVPSELIVGTKVEGRKNAFSANFMPMLDLGTEFSYKWIELCSAHLEEGIRDAVKCYEYLGRFYVQEGNKRVSVLKSMEAPTVPCDVIRIVPVFSQDPEILSYYDFMQFYQLSHLYQVRFNKASSYKKLQAALGYEPDHVWTIDQRKAFLSRFVRFKSVFDKLAGAQSDANPCDALLSWLEVYTMDQIREKTETEISKILKGILDDVRVQTKQEPVQVKTAPAPDSDKSILNRLFGIGKLPNLKVAFVNERTPEDSLWIAAHDKGRIHLETVMQNKVSVQVYNMKSPVENADQILETAVADGAQVIFATTPSLISACRKLALKYPDLYILNCSVSMPYTGLRTYYSRIYEGKFITGAIAGAMSDSDEIGYVASYPILGVPASINAFALGAQMTNPRAKILLHWSCTPGNCQDVFTRKGIRIISNRDIPAADLPFHDWGTYKLEADGTLLPLASPYWNWGKFYEKVVRLILDGLWDAENDTSTKKAVSYWWGMESGVIDIRLSDELPVGVKHLAKILRQSIVDGSLDPFHRPIISQDGITRNDGSQWFSPETILNMDWLCDNVVGSIPSFDQVLPMSRNMVRLLGIYRDQIQPEKGASPL